MYCALRTHLLDHNSPTSDELLHSLLTPLGFFSHPSAPKNTREPDLLGKMVEYMRFLHVTMRNTQADPRWCTKLRMSNVNGISQLTAHGPSSRARLGLAVVGGRERERGRR